MTAKPTRRLDEVRVIVVSETQHQRIAFSDTVRSCGLTLVDCITCEQVTQKYAQSDADIWLIDSSYDYKMIAAIEASKPDTVLVGFDTAPFLNESQRYAKWQRRLKRKLANMLDMPEIIGSKRFEASNRSWQFVVLLGASMGGPSAIKSFLDHLSTELPICILLAHHFNDKMIHTLPRILNRHNEWRCQVITTTQMLQPGQCLIAPVDKKIVCDSNGRVILAEQGWEGEYKPAIGTLLKNTSDVFGADLISIIFSGMGVDGSQHLEQIQENNSQLWAQDPDDSACASQPKAIIDSGYCQFVGTPAQLAQHLTDYVTEHRHSE